MLDAETNSNRMVETTDCLETVSVFKASKNFFFTVALISLLVTQVVFWLGHFNMIAWEPQETVVATDISNSLQENYLSLATSTTPMTIVEEAKVDPAIEEDAKEVIGVAQSTPQPQVVETDVVAETQEESLPSVASENKIQWRADWAYLQVFLKVANSILVFTVSCYMLILLFSLKVSLVGKLGGLSHISTAFLVSLFAALVILPWQLTFPGIHLSGAIFTPAELHDAISKFSDGGIIVKVFCYIRFVVSFVLAFWLLVWAQLRSRRWARATLKRLGIIQ